MLSDVIKYKATNGCRDMTDPVGRNSPEFRRWKCQFLSLQQIFFFFLAWVYHLGVNLTSLKLSYCFESNTVVVANAVINYLELSLYQQQDKLEMTAVEWCLFSRYQKAHLTPSYLLCSLSLLCALLHRRNLLRTVAGNKLLFWGRTSQC